MEGEPEPGASWSFHFRNFSVNVESELDKEFVCSTLRLVNNFRYVRETMKQGQVLRTNDIHNLIKAMDREFDDAHLARNF